LVPSLVQSGESSGVGIVGYQAVGCLEPAHWQPYTIGAALRDLGVPYFYTSFLGVQKIKDAVVLWPASLGYLAVAILLGWISFMASEEEIRIEREQELKRQMATGKRVPTAAEVFREIEETLETHSRERD
jgi:hypothetical protein